MFTHLCFTDGQLIMHCSCSLFLTAVETSSTTVVPEVHWTDELVKLHVSKTSGYHLVVGDLTVVQVDHDQPTVKSSGVSCQQ